MDHPKNRRKTNPPLSSLKPDLLLKRCRPLFLLSLLLTPACSSMLAHNNNDKQQVEFAVYKIKNDLEELKQDLSSYQMELGMLEGKLLNHEEDLSSIKDVRLHDSKSDPIFQLEQRIERLEKGQFEIKKQFELIETTNQQIIKSLSRYKTKFAEVEKILSTHSESLIEIAKIRKNLQDIQETTDYQIYKVKQGDSLEKIAKTFGTSIEEIRKINHLHNDLILVNQELKIPQ